MMTTFILSLQVCIAVWAAIAAGISGSIAPLVIGFGVVAMLEVYDIYRERKERKERGF